MLEAHAAALQHTLRASDNLHENTDENVAARVAATTASKVRDATKNPAKIIGASMTRDADLANDALNKRKANLKKTGESSKGGFAGLLKNLRAYEASQAAETVAKALTPTAPVTLRMNQSIDLAAVIKAVKTGTTLSGAKPAALDGSTFKAIDKSLDKAREMAKSLTAGYGTDSADLTGGDALRKHSLDRVVQATVVPSANAIMAKTSRALSEGRVTAAEANTVATHCSLNGGTRIDPDLLAKVMKDCK